MKKLLVALFAGAFALVSAAALAQDSTLMPLDKLTTQAAKEARVAAKEKWAKMTPEERAAAKKEARTKKRADLTALDEVAEGVPRQNAKEIKASKTMPKATKEERKKALEEQQKKASQ
jgi:hypothetical protein